MGEPIQIPEKKVVRTLVDPQQRYRLHGAISAELQRLVDNADVHLVVPGDNISANMFAGGVGGLAVSYHADANCSALLFPGPLAHVTAVYVLARVDVPEARKRLFGARLYEEFGEGGAWANTGDESNSLQLLVPIRCPMRSRAATGTLADELDSSEEDIGHLTPLLVVRAESAPADALLREEADSSETVGDFMRKDAAWRRAQVMALSGANAIAERAFSVMGDAADVHDSSLSEGKPKPATVWWSGVLSEQPASDGAPEGTVAYYNGVFAPSDAMTTPPYEGWLYSLGPPNGAVWLTGARKHDSATPGGGAIECNERALSMLSAGSARHMTYAPRLSEGTGEQRWETLSDAKIARIGEIVQSAGMRTFPSAIPTNYGTDVHSERSVFVLGKQGKTLEVGTDGNHYHYASAAAVLSSPPRALREAIDFRLLHGTESEFTVPLGARTIESLVAAQLRSGKAVTGADSLSELFESSRASRDTEMKIPRGALHRLRRHGVVFER